MAAVLVERRETGDVPRFSVTALLAGGCVIARTRLPWLGEARRKKLGSSVVFASTRRG